MNKLAFIQVSKDFKLMATCKFSHLSEHDKKKNNERGEERERKKGEKRGRK